MKQQTLLTGLIMAFAVGAVLVPGRATSAGGMESVVTFGSAFDVTLHQKEGGYRLNAAVEVKSSYPGTLRLQSKGVELISVSDDAVRQWAKLKVDPLELSTDATNQTAAATLAIVCETSDEFDLAALIAAGEKDAMIFVRGDFNILTKRGSGWMGLSGMSYEIPLSAAMCLPADTNITGRIRIDFLPARDGVSMEGPEK